MLLLQLLGKGYLHLNDVSWVTATLHRTRLHMGRSRQSMQEKARGSHGSRHHADRTGRRERSITYTKTATLGQTVKL